MTLPLSGTAVDSVLEQAPYVRGLARELVFDPHLARDVEQETLLAALEHAPREAGRLRGWLAAIVRNCAIKAWRSSARREQREQACARVEAVVPSPAEILEREDQRRLLIERVLALDEPLRAVVILRFFAELPPREVARRLELPVETVRTRTKRGLECLRERLDRESRGDRAAWCLALVRAFQMPASLTQLGVALVVTSLSGVLFLSLAQKAVLAAAAVALVGSVVVLREQGGTPEHVGAGESNVVALVSDDSPGAEQPLAPVALGTTPARTRSALPNPQPQPEIHLAAGGSLRVRLAWHDGTPAADVSATVHSRAAEDFYADAVDVRMGADGTARIEALPAGGVSVYCRGEAESATVVAGEEVELALAIPLGFHVDGIVVDGNGQPVAGAEVVADDSGRGWSGAVVARSGADGTFHVRSIGDGLCWLSARSPLCAPSARYVLVGGAGRTLDVQLSLPAPGGSLVGTVRDEAGQGIAHAQLLVGDEDAFRDATVPEGGEALAAAARRVSADENGHFEVLGLAAGRQEVRVRAKDFAPWAGEAEVSAGQAAELAVTLLAEARVEGTVRDASGAPVAGVEILSGRGGFLDRVTGSGADGSYSVRGLPSGEFALQVEGKGRGSVRTTLTGSPGALLRWDPMLDGGLTLRGRIVGAGVDPSACVVRCECLAEGEEPYFEDERPDEQGVFEFSGLTDAGHRLEVLAAGLYFFPLAVVQDLHPGAGETVIELDAQRWPSVHLRGRVLDASGDPLPGAALVPGLAGSGGRNCPLLTTDAAGVFDLGPYPPGRWTIFVQPGRSEELRTETVELLPGQTWDFGNLRLPE